MAIEHDIITLPAFWASALINGDESGMTGAEVAAMDAYLARALEGGWYVVSTADDSEGSFTWNYRVHGGDAEGGTVLDYVIHRTV